MSQISIGFDIAILANSKQEETLFSDSQYELLDFGSFRKLERVGQLIVDRPCPIASEAPETDLWDSANLSFGGDSKKWKKRKTGDDNWAIEWEDQKLLLETTPSGQIGVFPEQAPNWEYIRKKVKARKSPKVLNLFGYTGGSTLAAAAAGAEVVHIDAAKSVVNWARRNAEESNLGDAPIRWIVEDAAKFVAREVKRGSRYDGLVLDPPTYGHGPKGEEWKLSRDLIELLDNCKKLLSEDPMFFVLSCHTPGYGAAELSASLTTSLFGRCGAGVRTRDLSLTTRDGRRLFAGNTAYWP